VTKPPWPPIDGGRLVVAHTIAALAARGNTIDLIAPHDAHAVDPHEVARQLAPTCRAHLVAARPRTLLRAALGTVASRTPVSVARHDHPALRARLAELVREHRPDVVHAEQLQALAACGPAFAAGVPVVLRCQNVESDLWRGYARHARVFPLAALEARRLARFEARALRRATAAIALTAEDATRLQELSGGIPVETIAAPFPTRLKPGAAVGGDPAIATLGSSGWRPNEDGLAWLLREVWPAVRQALPEAMLHVYGDDGGVPATAPGIVTHPAPTDSREAFPAGAVCIVPLRYGSGVRMRILEAWARGVPVIATPEAVHGLGVRDGRELLVASTPQDFATALGRVRHEPALADALITAGRARVGARHDPETIAAQLEGVYDEAARRARDSAP
jgi:glycosyltransferase involved in cell wall biosynthesis